MKIAYVNIWNGFDQNGYPDKCHFTRILREVDPSLTYDIGYKPGSNYDLVISMFAPIPGHYSYADLNQISEKKLVFTGESYDVITTTPGGDAYIGFDLEEDVYGSFKYLRFPLYAIYHMDYLIKYSASSFENLRNLFSWKSRIPKVSAVISNPSNNLRNSVLDILIQHNLCDSGGRLKNTLGQLVSDKLGFINNYSMNLAFENLERKSYITEKIYESLITNSVPFYYGAPDISMEFNPASFVRLDVSNDQAARDSIQHAVNVLSDPDQINKLRNTDPITGFRSEKYIRNGKDILKTFVMNLIETK